MPTIDHLRPAAGPPGFFARLQWRIRTVDRRQTVGYAAASVAAATLGWAILTARQAAQDLGATRNVMVVTQPVPTGASLNGATEWRAVPEAALPDDAVETPAALAGDVTATADLAPGEVLRAGRTSAVSTLGLTPGERAVTVPTPLAPGPITPGMRVDVVGVRAVGDGGVVSAQVLARAALVLVVDPDGITMALNQALVAPVLETLAVGSIELAITPG